VGFYGREAELALLRDDLEIDVPKGEREFRAYYIAGRRGVGKSELLERVKPMAGKDTPFVSVTIREDSDATACLEDLERSVENSGQASLLDGRPSPGRFDRARHRFVDTVRHLLGQGAIMAIDPQTWETWNHIAFDRKGKLWKLWQWMDQSTASFSLSSCVQLWSSSLHTSSGLSSLWC